MERNEAISWLLEMYKNTKMPSSYMDPNRDKKGEALKIAINSLEVDEAYQLEYEEMTGEEMSEDDAIAFLNSDDYESAGFHEALKMAIKALNNKAESVSLEMSPKEALKYIWDFISSTNFKADDTTLFNLGRAIGTLDVAIYNKEKEDEANNNN